MHPAASEGSQNFLSLYDPSPPRSRHPSGLAASIWAPQPQPSESTWPQTLDSFSLAAESDFPVFGGPQPTASSVVTREDVFGPVDEDSFHLKDVGAVGDGRKQNRLDFDDTVR